PPCRARQPAAVRRVHGGGGMTVYWNGWAVSRLRLELAKAAAGVEGTSGVLHVLAQKLSMVGDIAGAIVSKGGNGDDMNLDVLERQIESIIAQSMAAREMIAQLRAVGGAHAAVSAAGPERRIVPIDPIASLRVE